MKNLEHDFIIIGSGLAGLAAAYHASKFGNVAILTKASLDVSNSYFAQGGIAAALHPDDTPHDHLLDTLEAGRGLCDVDSVEILVNEGKERVSDLIDMGMQFDKKPDGEFFFGLEGGHSKRRILHAAGASTGREITKFMVEQVKRIPNITAYEHTKAVELHIKNGRCYGLKAICFDDMSTLNFSTNVVILATGGLSRLYQRSTNPYTATGDGIALAWNSGAQLVDMEFIQFHPTAMMIPGKDAFLLSEAIRGEGAYLLDKNGNRFMVGQHPLNELAPRDTVAIAIYNQMKKDNTSNVFLSLKHLDANYIKERFSVIYEEVQKMGLDLTHDLIPIAPAAHYMVGGIRTGLHAETNIEGLWACGEVASTGVMGANRLASNSLLECLVFAKRAVDNAAPYIKHAHQKFDTKEIVYDTNNVDTFLEIKNKISDIMSNNVCIVRNEEGLTESLNLLKNIHEKYKDCEDEYNFNKIKNIANISFLITRSALIRKESRGGHVREDFPNTDPNMEFHIVQQRNVDPCFVKIRK